jgi:NADPH:quinone reductase-like Zn-dependent oxidoreductase
MKAVRFHEYGEPSVLRYEDAARPDPTAGQVLIEVAGTIVRLGDGDRPHHAPTP